MRTSQRAASPLTGDADGEQRERERERETTAGVGLVIGFAALIMTFATLLLAYGTVRVQAGAWPPPDEPRLPASMWPWPAAATLVVVLCSVTMDRAARMFGAPRPGRAGHLGLALAATAGAGALFLAIQLSGAMRLLALGIRPSAGIGMSVVYAFTAFHAMHALAAVIAVALLGAQVLGGRPVRRATVSAVAAFVHLVAALWIVVCVTVFVL
jgi:heme/copper-type cytochrome/quinol oxidase subunit 3